MLNKVCNVCWFIFGGEVVLLLYWVLGIVYCATIIGIPFGVQMFKLSRYIRHPFGLEIVDGPHVGSTVNEIYNWLWFFLGWLLLTPFHLILGVLLSITIVGLPLGGRHLEYIGLMKHPFGTIIQEEGTEEAKRKKRRNKNKSTNIEIKTTTDKDNNTVTCIAITDPMGKKSKSAVRSEKKKSIKLPSSEE